jgi:hypothetical protein
MKCKNNQTLKEIIFVFQWRQIVFTESFNKRVIELEIIVLYPWNGHQMLSPIDEFSSVFGYLIENRYKLEHLKSANG